MPLNAKQERFVEEYLKDLNATQAAIRAGYAENSAQEQSSRLLSNDMVQEAVLVAKQKRSKRINVTADLVVQEMAKLATADSRELFNEDGSVKPPSEWTDQAAACVSSFTVRESKDGKKTYSVKVYDKNIALTNLGKHVGAFVEKHEITGRDGGPIEVEETTVEGRELARQIAFALAAGKKAAE